jgi:hypothetical protein
VKNAATCARKLTSLIKKLPASAPPMPEHGDDGLHVLVHSFLLWESTADKAQIAYAKLNDAIVDFNDLRVTLPHELVEVIGQRYPRGLDRAQRLRAALRDVYLREHTMQLERLADLGKREIRKYVESLDGIVPFVAARVMLLSFGVHAVPVDEQLRDQLAAAGAAADDVNVADLSAWLARQVKSADGPAVHGALQAWSDKQGAASRRSAKKTGTAGAGKKKKKTTPRKKTTASRRRSAARAGK